MSKNYDAIVVGGGLAGLTSAAYLSKYGYRTLLCEKGKKTGGLVNTFWHKGFAFDGGIRAFENSGIIFPMLKSLGIKLDVSRNPVSVGIGDRWTELQSKDSLKDYSRMLAEIFPDDGEAVSKIADEIRKVMGYMDVLYGIENPLFLEDMKDREYLMKTLLPWLIRYQLKIGKASRMNEPVNDYLKRFTKNQELIDMITQHFFKETPSFFALSYFGLYLDYSYPKGGTGVLAEKMTEYIRSMGGEILTETEITHVDSSKHEIRTADGETLSYRKLVWAADQKSLYSEISGTMTPEMEKQKTLVEENEGGDSILTLYIGTSLSPDYFQGKCGAHAFYTPVTKGLSTLPSYDESMEKGLEEMKEWVRSYLKLTTYEISCPALRDESLAPEGKTGLIISTLMDYRLVRKFQEDGAYEAFKKLCTEIISETLASALFPELNEHTEFALCSTPLTILRETGNAEGAITGWAFTGDMPAENRFKKIAKSVMTPIEDVYQCGQWTFSPSGLPVSILTGKLAADEVRKTLKGTLP